MPSLRLHRLRAVLTVLVALLGTRPVAAQIDPTHEGLASNGLCGLGVTGFPVCPRRVGLSATGSYGYTESVGPVSGSHQRIAGSIGAGITPLPFLSVALRFDGRLDFHPKDDLGSDKTGTGDPRLFLRGGHRLNEELALGGEAVLWFPGNDAPSFKPRAITVDLKAMAAWTPRKLPFALLGHVGYRVDQSAESAPDFRRYSLRPGDRVALSLSESDAVLLAVGISTRAVQRTQLFAELSLDYLVGDRAPQFSVSPLRGTLGARGFLNKTLQGELSATVALNGRPSIDAGVPLVPIEPRFSLNLAVRYGYDLSPPPPPPPAQGVAPVVVQPVDEPVRTANFSGTLVDDTGAPLPDVRVSLRTTPDGEALETVTDGEGHYRFAGVAVGPAALEATAPGFDSQRWTVDIRPDMATEANRPLVRKGDLGTLRLLTRTFSSDPLSVAVLIRDARGRKVKADNTNAEGLLEFDLPPGRYVVMISAAGYRPHRREVLIERYGVAILNVDMREQK